MNNELNNLNEKQQIAVKYTNGSMLIYAGAGSGKTKTIVSRIDYLVNQNDVSPKNILAITFTNKAAREMKERLENTLGEDARFLTICTFHSFCVRVLRRYAKAIGYSQQFVILDDDDQATVIKSILKEKNIDAKKYPPKFFLSKISKLKNKSITPQEYLKNDDVKFNSLKLMTGDIYDLYQKELFKNNYMDFDDLIVNTVHLFKESEIARTYYNQRYQYIHVDEYQDTNQAQFELLKLLSTGNYVCAVGDTDQAIYSWRGATITNIQNFEKDFTVDNNPPKVIKLEQNYRSTQQILDCANHLIVNNKNRKSKNLFTKKADGEKVLHLSAKNEYEETDKITAKIKQLVYEHNYKYKDIALLYRINSLSLYLERALQSAQIPYKIIGNLSYFKRKEIKDLLAYMRLISTPTDNVAFIRAIGTPRRGIGKTSIEKLQSASSTLGISIYDVIKTNLNGLVSPRIEKLMIEFIDWIDTTRKNILPENIIEFPEIIMKDCGYIEELEAEDTVESQARIDNIMEFKTYISNFMKNLESVDIDDLGYDLSNANDLLNLIINNVMLDTVEAEDETDDDKITLMSIHTAKGTEYPCVFVVALEDGIFPLERAAQNPDELEEERRLAYVAFTRAKERLYLTSADTRMRYGAPMRTKISKFIEEVIEKIETPFNQRKSIFRDRNSSKYERFGGLEYNNTITNNQSDNTHYPKEKVKTKELDVTATNSAPAYEKGDKVTHSYFGDGIVISASDDIVTIAFQKPHGLKKLIANIPMLSKKN